MGSPPPSETDVLADVVETVVRAALAPVVARLRAVEQLVDEPVTRAVLARLTAVEATTAEHGEDLRAVGTRIQELPALVALTAVPGPAGPPGPPGADGVGLTYCGVWFPARTYERGEFVTHDGSLWHAKTATTAKPGDGTADWTLAVKRGRDAR